MSTQHFRFLVIGAGPTGLGAGYRLQELGIDRFQLIDQHAYLGGLATSFKDAAGFTWDIGGHVMFSHYEYYDRVFETLMKQDFTWIDRVSYIRSMDRWVPYPFQNNIRHLPKEIAYECLSGLIKAQHGRGACPSPSAARNFAEFIDAVFGEGLARHFMRPYNFKVWAHPPEMMNKTWIGERVAVIDVDRALRNVVLDRDDVGWGPNNRFKFPLFGGTGEFYKRFGPLLGDHVRLSTRVEAIDAELREAKLSTGERVRYEAALSTMPLDLLCGRVITSKIPQRVRRAAASLRHSAGHFVGVGIRRPCPRPWSWMYFPEANCPFYRVTYLSNYSPNMTPDRETHYSLLCEISESEFKPVDASQVVDDTLRGLESCGLLEPGERDDIVSIWTHSAEYAYPTPTVDRDELLAEVIPWLEARGLYSRGRFGMWKYEVSNTDHSLMQGVEWADRMVNGTPEKTMGMTYRITSDGREAGEHLRPAVAGSGERRPVAPDAVSADAGAHAQVQLRRETLQAGVIGEEEVGVG
jgi:protoporphyrinogen oxidase